MGAHSTATALKSVGNESNGCFVGRFIADEPLKLRLMGLQVGFEGEQQITKNLMIAAQLDEEFSQSG
jgi:hypothetical protein